MHGLEMDEERRRTLAEAIRILREKLDAAWPPTAGDILDVAELERIFALEGDK